MPIALPPPFIFELLYAVIPTLDRCTVNAKKFFKMSIAIISEDSNEEKNIGRKLQCFLKYIYSLQREATIILFATTPLAPRYVIFS